MTRSRLVIAEDHPGMLEWLTSALQKEFDIVGTARNGVDAVEAIRQHKPDVLVLDVAMSRMNGFEVMRSLQKMRAKTAVILITTYTNPELEQAAISAGAHAYIEKFRLADELIPAIRSAAS